MPLDYPRLFKNPLIPPAHYLATVKSVETCQVVIGTESRTALEVVLEIDHYGPPIDGTRLYSILQPSDKGQPYIDWFLSSYRVTMSTLDKAIGRWAVVYVSESQYKGTFHSLVRFQHQTHKAQEVAAALEAEAL